jgi:hypothetical protein
MEFSSNLVLLELLVVIIIITVKQREHFRMEFDFGRLRRSTENYNEFNVYAEVILHARASTNWLNLFVCFGISSTCFIFICIQLSVIFNMWWQDELCDASVFYWRELYYVCIVRLLSIPFFSREFPKACSPIKRYH